MVLLHDAHVTVAFFAQETNKSRDILSSSLRDRRRTPPPGVAPIFAISMWDCHCRSPSMRGLSHHMRCSSTQRATRIKSASFSLTDHLNTNGHAVRPLEKRQRNGWQTGQGPNSLNTALPVDSSRASPGAAGNQRIVVLEQAIQGSNQDQLPRSNSPLPKFRVRQ